MSDLVAAKLAAIKSKMRAEADASGYGSFISDEKIGQWATDVLAAIDDVENASASGEASAQGQSTASEGTDTI